MFLSALIIIASSLPYAEPIKEKSVPFLHYFDCMRANVKPSVDIDVFMKVLGSRKRRFQPGSYYAKGFQSNLLLGSENDIRGIQFGGPDMELSLNDLKNGVQFGVFGKTLHTIEVAKDFDPKKGGKLIIGYMSDVPFGTIIAENFAALLKAGNVYESDTDLIEAREKFSPRRYGLSGSLSRHYNTKENPRRWNEAEFEVKNLNGEWVVFDNKGNRIDTIYADFKIPDPARPVITGIADVNGVFADHRSSENRRIDCLREM